MYLLPSSELSTFIGGSSRCAEKEIRWILRRGATSKQVEMALDAVFRVPETPLTRNELVRAVGKLLDVPVSSRQGGGWGSARQTVWLKVGCVACPAGYLLHLAGAPGGSLFVTLKGQRSNICAGGCLA